jgi:hypothetical protein
VASAEAKPVVGCEAALPGFGCPGLLGFDCFLKPHGPELVDAEIRELSVQATARVCYQCHHGTAIPSAIGTPVSRGRPARPLFPR